MYPILYTMKKIIFVYGWLNILFIWVKIKILFYEHGDKRYAVVLYVYNLANYVYNIFIKYNKILFVYIKIVVQF